jgi:hypothetical protein
MKTEQFQLKHKMLRDDVIDACVTQIALHHGFAAQIALNQPIIMEQSDDGNQNIVLTGFNTSTLEIEVQYGYDDPTMSPIGDMNTDHIIGLFQAIETKEYKIY